MITKPIVQGNTGLLFQVLFLELKSLKILSQANWSQRKVTET